MPFSLLFFFNISPFGPRKFRQILSEGGARLHPLISRQQRAPHTPLTPRSPLLWQIDGAGVARDFIPLIPPFLILPPHSTHPPSSQIDAKGVTRDFIPGSSVPLHYGEKGIPEKGTPVLPVRAAA